MEMNNLNFAMPTSPGGGGGGDRLSYDARKYVEF